MAALILWGILGAAFAASVINLYCALRNLMFR